MKVVVLLLPKKWELWTVRQDKDCGVEPQTLICESVTLSLSLYMLWNVGGLGLDMGCSNVGLVVYQIVWNLEGMFH